MWKLAFFFLLGACNAYGAERALYACPDTLAKSAAGKTGQRLVMDTAAPAPDCRRVPLALDGNRIVAVQPLARDLAASPGEVLTIQGQEKQGRFMISEIDTGSDAPEAARKPMPFRENLLAAMTWRTFGVEERVRVIADGSRLALECKAGSKPAGIVLTGPWYLPMADMQLQIESSGEGSFEVLSSDSTRLSQEQPLSIGTLAAGREVREIALPLKLTNFNRKRWHSLAIACPDQAAVLHLSRISIVPLPRSAASRSAWVWNPQSWHNEAEQRFSHAARYGIRTLFISVPVEAGRIAQPDRLAAFIREAGRRGIEVWSVDGDPRMVLPQEQQAAVQRAQAYARYNGSVEPAARLRGMQFDIEPYLLADYAAHEQQHERWYIDLLGKLNHAASGLPLELVVPFWWADKPALMQALARHASHLAVMDYRTDPEQIVRFAVPFLDWAEMHGKRVRIALEAGPVAEEIQRRYVRADQGQAWVTEINGQPALLLLKDAARNPDGPSYRLDAQKTIDGTATTFHGNTARMLTLLPQLEADFSAWPHFHGLALHELK